MGRFFPHGDGHWIFQIDVACLNLLVLEPEIARICIDNGKGFRQRQYETFVPCFCKTASTGSPFLYFGNGLS
jgi:hypothetical protein